jgi:hypothetical protein
MMTQEANVAAIYPDHDSAELAHRRTHEVLGCPRRFLGGIWGLLLCVGFFLVPGAGSVLVAGPLLGAVVTGLDSAAVIPSAN